MRVLMLPVAAAILLIGADLLCAPAANAQVQSPSPGAAVQPSNIPDQKLDAVAAAAQRVTSLTLDYQQRIAAAAPADKERILNEAQCAAKSSYRPRLVGRGIQFNYGSGAERS